MMSALRRDKTSSGFRGSRQAGCCATLFLYAISRVNAQSADAPVSPPTSQQPPESVSGAPQKDSAPTPASTPKPTAPTKAKKVITNDDLEPHASGQSHAAANGDSGSYLTCEATCEQEAREEAGYDADREAEWQMQIVNARRELAADVEWRRLLLQAIDQSNRYCNFLSQQSQKVAPSGNSYSARLQRAKADQYFQNMDKTLQQGLQNLAAQMTRHTNEVGELSPVRGAMMHVQGERILQRTCQFPGIR